MGASDEGPQDPGTPMHIHPNCKCVSEPIVGKPVPRPSADELFRAMSAVEQDDQFGKAKADALRTGAISFSALVARRSFDGDADDFIFERSLESAE